MATTTKEAAPRKNGASKKAASKKAANGSTATKKTTAEPKQPAKPKAAKSTTPTGAKKPRAPKEDLVVFAFRLTENERNQIHATAGPARASRFIRRVAAAFANEDEAAFRAVLKEARAAR